MRIDPTAVARNSGQGRLSTARLLVYLLVAVILMALDQRGQFIPKVRSALEAAVQPAYYLVELPVSAARGIYNYSRSYGTVLDETRALDEQLLTQAGEIQRLAALEEENRRLRALLDASAGRDMEFLFAEMTLVSLDPYSHQVLIDHGRQEGAFEGQAVIDGLGVMGQVESVQWGQSRVRLISDPDHAIPVQILRTGQRTVALGTGDPGRLSLPNLPTQSDVREGDELVTSGLGERFPPGFPVATVTRIARDTGGAFLSVDAVPLAELDRGREVLLVVPTAASVMNSGEPVGDGTGIYPNLTRGTGPGNASEVDADAQPSSTVPDTDPNDEAETGSDSPAADGVQEPDAADDGQTFGERLITGARQLT